MNNYVLCAPEFVIVPTTIVLVGAWMRRWWLVAVGVAVLAAALVFFRGWSGAATDVFDLDRPTVACPCDGTVTSVEETHEHVHVAVFLNVHNVHVQYAPVGGRVLRVQHKKGEFRPAYMTEKSRFNERLETTVRSPDFGDVIFVQIAGQMARRCVSFLRPGEAVRPLQPVGLIKLGSRCDVWVPRRQRGSNVYTVVRRGDRVHIGAPLVVMQRQRP